MLRYQFLNNCLIVAFLFLCSRTVYGQETTYLDSLRKQWKISENRPTLIPSTFDLLRSLFKATNTNRYEEALGYAEIFFERASQAGDSSRMIEGGRMKAFSFLDLGENEKAIQSLLTALGIAVRNEKLLPEIKIHFKYIYNNLGLAYTYMGNYDQALYYHLESLKAREAEGDLRGMCNTYNNIGLVYFNLKDFDLALDNYRKALEISKKVEIAPSVIETLYINIGLAYNSQPNFKEAINAFEEGFMLCQNECSDNMKKMAYQGLGVAYFQNREYEKAETNFSLSQVIAQRQSDNNKLSENLFYLSRIKTAQNNLVVGLNLLEQAKKIAESASFVETRLNIYREYINIFKSQNNFQKSFEYNQMYDQLRDSVYNQKLIRNLAKIQINYAERENIKTISDQRQILALKETVINGQKRQYIFTIVIAGLLVGLVVISYRHRRLLLNQNKRLEANVKQRTNQLSRANDELDYFIYKTSHDIRGPLLSLIGLCGLALKEVKEGIALTYLEQLQISAVKLNKILSRLQMVNVINTSVIQPEVIDINAMIAEIMADEKKNGLPERFTYSVDIEPGCILTTDKGMFRLILENLIDNAIKFNNTSVNNDPYVRVETRKDKSYILVRVIDNGIGIDQNKDIDIFKMFTRASEKSETGGVGLYLSRLSTEKLKGEIELEYSSRKGSSFVARLPSNVNSKSNQINQEIEIVE